MEMNTLNDVLTEQLGDLYSAEQQILKALPKMIKSASHRELQRAFTQHQRVTERQVQRLERIFKELDERPTGKKCHGMEGLISEGSEVAEASGDGDARDAALIGAAQRVEHYEIAAYGTARTLADDLGIDDAKELLDQTLDEEANADKLLTKLATGGMFRSGINQEAASRN